MSENADLGSEAEALRQREVERPEFNTYDVSWWTEDTEAEFA